MKLLVDARTGWGHGIGRVIVNLVPRIGRIRPEWRIDALVLPEHIAEARDAFSDCENVTIVACSIRPFSMAEQTALSSYVEGHDLTWFTNYWVPLGWRTPFVATVHDMLHLLPQLVPASPIKRALARQTFKKVRRDARAVTFVSRYTEQAFRHMIGDPREGITVPNGADHLILPNTVPLRQRSSRLLVVAAAKKHKNFALLFDAWRRARVPQHWILTVISPDERLLHSVDLAELASGDARIDLHRGVSNAELAALYGDTAVLLMPSLYEGFGLPLLEGMLAGALCVSSAAGAMVEIAEGSFVHFVNGSDLTGWVSAIEGACALIDGDNVDLDTLTRHNIACAERFSWDGAASGMARVLTSAC